MGAGRTESRATSRRQEMKLGWVAYRGLGKGKIGMLPALSWL